jgi:hypothetical protein
MTTKKQKRWHPNTFIKYVGPACVALAFGWVGIRLLMASQASIVPGGAVQLYVSPATSSVTQNQQFSVTVRINTNGQTVNAVRSDLTYPASQLEFVSTTNPCVDPPFGVTAENLPGTGTPTPGSVKIACGSFTGATGDYAVATLTFKALANTGTATISFASTSEALLKSDNSNQLGSTTSATVQMNAPAPTITSVAPTSGSTAGGTAVTITGTNFVTTPSVRFGNNNATNISRVSDTTVTATTPASSTTGAATVTVTVGTQTTSKSAAFTYTDTAAPTKPGTPTVTNNQANQVSLSWTASTDSGGSGLAGYKVYRNGTQLGSNLATGNTYTDSTVQANTTYSYTVAAVDGAGNTSAQSSAVSVTTRYKGDIDNNGSVNLTDLSILLSNWNKTGALSSDLDGNGVVNLTDLSMLLTNWGRS